MKHSRLVGSCVGVLLMIPAVAFAAGMFPDVNDAYPFKGEIESLARSGVINGNPDGHYYPDRSVNRAEFLKMLYTATGRKPKAIYVKCFTDVVVDSWYESFVCDASSRENGFVQGYPDGKFRPANPVTRTEALKMVFNLFNLNTPNITQKDKDIIKFVDISTSAWYSKFISAAYGNGMLPITGQSDVRFYPDQQLTRGEAAAYIFNAEKALDRQGLSQQSSSSLPMEESNTSLSSSSSSKADAVDLVKNVVFPFSDSGQFSAKRPVAYVFNLSSQTEVWIQTSVSGYYPSDVTCRLYLLNKDGFSDEYYLGFQERSTCTLKVAAKPGKYQLQIQPTVENVPFVVTGKVDLGDGNDGFVDAPQLQPNLPHTDILGPGDLFDWYKFTIDKEQTATVDVSASEKLECVIYTPGSVDQYGFVGPECGKPYLFEPGNPVAPYYLGVGRLSGDSIHKVPYTVKLQK